MSFTASDQDEIISEAWSAPEDDEIVKSRHDVIAAELAAARAPTSDQTRWENVTSLLEGAAHPFRTLSQIPAFALNLPTMIKNRFSSPEDQSPMPTETGRPMVQIPLTSEDIKAGIRNSPLLSNTILGANPDLSGGVIRGGMDIAESMTTPENATALVATGGLSAPYQRAVGAAFSDLIASDVPEAAQRFGEATVNETPAEAARAGTRLAADILLPSGIAVAPEIAARREAALRPAIPIRASNFSPEDLLRLEDVSRMRQAQAAQAGEPIRQSITDQLAGEPSLPLGRPSGLTLAPEAMTPDARGGIPANAAMLELLPEGRMEIPAVNELLRQRARGGATRAVEEQGQQIRREQDFPAALAEKTAEDVRTQVGEGVAAEATPMKALTENQIKITVDSLRKEIEEGRFPEAKGGGIGEGIRRALEKNKEAGSINLEILKDIVEFGKGIFQKGMDFAKWSREMVTHLGKQVLGYLGDAWNALKGQDASRIESSETPTREGDIARFGELEAQFQGLIDKGDFESAEFLRLFSEKEAIKNLYGGLVPGRETPTAGPNAWIDRLESLKSKHDPTRLYMNPFQIPVAIWDGALHAMQLAIKAGKSIADAVNDFIEHLKTNKANFDEAKVRDYWARLDKPMKMEGETAAEPAKPAAAESTVPVSKVTPKESAKMESRVKLPVEKNVEKIAGQFDLFLQEIDDALTTGGKFLEKEMRPEVAKGAPAERGTVTSKQVNQHFVNKLVTLTRELRRAENESRGQADPVFQSQLKLVRARAEQAFRQVQELRRASHEALYFWNKIKGEYQEIASLLGQMPKVREWTPYLDRIWKGLRDKDYADAGRSFMDMLRVNLFTMGSWTLDFMTNGLALASELPGWAAMDLASLATGNAPNKFRSVLRALSPSTRGSKGRSGQLPLEIETELGTVVGGERVGIGREVMVNFSEILRDHPELADKLKKIDLVIAAPVRLKRAVDNFFGRLGASSELFYQGYEMGRKRGLKGDDLKRFADDFVARPTEQAAAGAVKAGKEMKFNRDLSNWEESFSSNLAVRAFVETFPRWTFQFTRWAGEMIGVNPSLWKSVMKGEAKAPEVINYLSKAATGWGAIYAFNQLFYDNIDANSMEYVTEKGDRIRLSGRTPAPELYFVNALLRRDWQKAKAALQHVSFPGAKLLSGQPAGLVSPVVDTMRQSIDGRYTAQQTAAEFTKLVNDMIPGKSMLGLIRAFFDPTIREGVGSPIPGISSLLPQRSNPTTGEPLAPKQRIPGTSITIPTVAGTPFPGAERVLNPVEKALLNHGLALSRPRRTSIIDLPAEGVPKEVRREYEKRAGQYVNLLTGTLVGLEEFKSLPFDIRRELLQDTLSEAQKLAKEDLNIEHGTLGLPVRSEALKIQRLPERLRH